MTGAGYAAVALDDLPWTRHHGGAAWAALTAPLGATEIDVDALRLRDDDAVQLASEPEQLLVLLDGSITIEAISTTVGHPGLALAPAGGSVSLSAAGPSTLLVVSVAADPAPDSSPRVVDLEAADFVVPSTSDIATAFLTTPLGCTGMKANARRLGPGQAVPLHTEGDQEELFVPVEGPASLRVDETTHPLPTGHVARVAPDVPRSAVNDGAEDALWVMVGAPPTGGPTGWDPGAEILE